MRSILILSIFCAGWELGSTYPNLASTKAQLEDEKVNRPPMSTLSDDQKSFIINQLRSLCLLKPSLHRDGDFGDQWTIGLKRSIFLKISLPEDTEETKLIKRYLTDSTVNEAVSKCDMMNNKLTKQGDNDDIFEGLQAILTNVFSGNLFGVIESSVGIRSPEGLRVMMSDIMRNLLENISSAQQAISSGTSNAGNLNNIGSGVGLGLRPAAAAGTGTANAGAGTGVATAGTGTATGTANAARLQTANNNFNWLG